MVAKCANPLCPARFRYLSQGKLFRLEVDYGKYEYFWLCADCAPKMSLQVEWGRGVVAVPAPAGHELHWRAEGNAVRGGEIQRAGLCHPKPKGCG